MKFSKRRDLREQLSMAMGSKCTDGQFDNRDLYTLQRGHELNEDIIAGRLRYPGTSFISIDKLTVNNNGVNHDIKNAAASEVLIKTY